MMELCDRITEMCGGMNKLIGDELEKNMGYSLEKEEIPIVMACVDTARKAGQVKGSRMAWHHKKGWLVFRRVKEDLSCMVVADRPSWIITQPKPECVTMRVPRHLAYKVQQFIKEQEVTP